MIQDKGKDVINMKLIVAGSRGFDDYKLLSAHLDDINRRFGISEIVSGTARGADRLGERYAVEHGIAIKRFPADWNNFGRAAGYIRNEQMAKYADACICFWIDGSKGTGHMINLARQYGLRLRIVSLKGSE